MGQKFAQPSELKVGLRDIAMIYPQLTLIEIDRQFFEKVLSLQVEHFLVMQK